MISDNDILTALHQADNNKTLAARLLQIPRHTFRAKLDKINKKKRKGTGKNQRILFISDLHTPYQHQDVVEFLKAVKEKYHPSRTIIGGDEVDNHAISFHTSDPNLMSPGDELEAAIYELGKIHAIFPKADVIDSNHGALFLRRGKDAHLPRQIFKPMHEILDTPGWTWHPEILLTLPNKRNVLVKHGVAKNPTLASKHLGVSLVQFHFHTQFLIQYYMSAARGMLFAMNCGCLVDREGLGQLYAKDYKEKQTLGVGLIIDNKPVLQPLFLDEHERWTGDL